MIKPIFASRIAVLLGCLAACATLGIKAMNKPNAATVAVDPGVKLVAAANTDFGFRLLHTLDQSQSDGNIFFSPLSISSALTMTLNGAGGQTERAMAKTLGLEAVKLDQINKANGLLLPSLASPDPKVEVKIANALWVRRGFTLAPSFQDRCHRFYKARAESLDFGSPEAVSTINNWVGENTEGKIMHLVSQPDIASSTAVLTNAIYFHGLWQTPFDKDAPQSAPFLLAGGGEKMVPMMQQEGSLSYSETAEGQAVSLPYGDGRMSLYVLLPKNGRSAQALAKNLDAKTWSARVAGMKPTRLTVFLPHFKAESSEHLKGPLSALGMGTAFERGADFRPMGLSGSFIGDVIHTAVLDVDENGTTAAAATSTAMTASIAQPPSTVMRVDHPFFLAIRDNVTGTILFEGVIRDPK